MADYLTRQKVERALVDCLKMVDYLDIEESEGHKVIYAWENGFVIDLTILAERLADELGL